MAHQYAGAMQLAMQARRPAQEGINAARPKVEEALAELDGLLINDKKKAIAAQLMDDPNLPDDVRSDFRKLLAIHDDLKQLLEKPDTNVNAYLSRNRDLSIRFLTQAAALAKSLGLEPPKKEDDE